MILTKLDKQLIKMLKENTGIALCDSGGANGRHWQRNQKRSFIKEPRMTLEVSEDSCSVMYNVFHFLREHLGITLESEKMWKEFRKFSRRKNNKDVPWLGLMEEFLHTERVTYTYNFETLLSQDIQFIFDAAEELVLLQIHNGCDARGGMTTPYAFYVDNYSDFLENMGRFGLRCGNTIHDPRQQCVDGVEIPAICEVELLTTDCGNNFEVRGPKNSYTSTALSDHVEFDKENNKLKCKKCGGDMSVF
jgi:hypothetical protein